MSGIVAGLAVLALLIPALSVPRLAQADPRAVAAFERSKTTTVTYALYNWNWVRTSDGEAHSEWSAEFHSGMLHRVETPLVRIVANCTTGTGSILDVRTGEIRSAPAAAHAACGISTSTPMVALIWLRSGEGRYGPLDIVSVLDQENERTYAIDADGILIAAEIFPRASGAQCLHAEAVAVERSLPEGDIFSVDSLRRSVVPDRFREAPAAPSEDMWLGERRCP